MTSARAEPAHVITLLSRPGCHLCEAAREVIEKVTCELGIPWTERDITASEADTLEYGDMIPVTLIDGVQHDFWRVDEARLRAALVPGRAGRTGQLLPERSDANHCRSFGRRGIRRPELIFSR